MNKIKANRRVRTVDLLITNPDSKTQAGDNIVSIHDSRRQAQDGNRRGATDFPPYYPDGFRAKKMAISIRHHSAWPQLAPYFVVEKCNPGDSKRARFRLELSKMTPGLAKLALGVTVKCCSCGSPIHPIRSRRPPGNKRSKAVGGGFYFAVACPLRRSIGCSRGPHAKAEYLAVRAAIDEVGR